LLPGSGWLRGLDDPELSEVLHLIHERPAEPWTVASLAGRVHMSRSAFAARFKTVVRKSPLDYLVSWRMQIAAARLRQRDGTPLAELAREVGYDTDAAFGKAFKRVFGRTPGQFRRAAQEPANGPRSVLQAELKKRDPFELPEQEVGLNLIRTTFQFGRETEQLFVKHRLDSLHFNILRILRGMGVAASPDEITPQLLVPCADITDHLTVLRKRKLIARAPARGTNVRITPAGLRLLAALDEPVMAMHRRQLGHLTATELDELNRLLVKARGSGQ
jgi:AraC-like DNA-binding protein/DNA-binding MarR family transcriptional regulator